MGWKSIVKSVAPIVGTALGGPMAGAAIKSLSNALLGNDEGTEKELEAYVDNATPDQLLKIKELDANFKLQMEKLGVDVFALEVKDRDSARNHHKDHNMPSIICIFLTLMVCGGIYGLITQNIPPENANILYMALGQVLTAWAGSIAYWVGTTKSSGEKSKMLGIIK